MTSDTLMAWSTQLVIILVLMPPSICCGKGMVVEAAGVSLKKKSSNEERFAIDFCRESECELGGHIVTCWCCMLPLKSYNCRLERNECWNDCTGWRGATRNNP